MKSGLHAFVSRAMAELSRWNNRGTSELPAYRRRVQAMTTASEYRQYAEECLAAMRAAVIPEVRSALFIAAQRWDALADRLAAREDLAAAASARASDLPPGAPARN
jgi:hypothetical protein